MNLPNIPDTLQLLRIILLLKKIHTLLLENFNFQIIKGVPIKYFKMKMKVICNQSDFREMENMKVLNYVVAEKKKASHSFFTAFCQLTQILLLNTVLHDELL